MPRKAQANWKGKKFLLVHSSAELYGSDRCMLSIVEGLVDRGAVAHVAIPESGELVGELEKVGARIHILDTVVFRRDVLSTRGMARLLLRIPWSVARLMRLMKRERYDLVHTNTGVTVGGAIAARLSGIPHVWHFREILSEFGLFLRFYQPLIVILSQRFIFITGAVRDQFSSQRIRKKGSIIHDGIPVEDYKGILAEVDDGPIVVTSIGRLAPYKGQNVLIEAIAQAADQGIELQTYIVGDVYSERYGYREELRSQAAQLGLAEKVHFTGFVEDVLPFLEKCNMFILSSTRPEGLGIVLLEAMAAGRAVIATDGGGAREIVAHNIDGLLVPPGDSGLMAKAIVRLARDTEARHRLAAAGNEKVKLRFSKQTMVDNILELYDEIITEQQ
ncbi:MAG: glycosyltransferase [Thermoleophilia bacterium]